MFWCSDYMIHSAPSFLTSVKMLSTRMQNGEFINGEGKRSIHLSDAANFLYLRGDEYENILPVWDWTRIPGTTEAATNSEGSTCQTVNRMGNSPFVGGVSNGVIGLSAMDLECGTLRGKKALFFFPSYFVALGASITASGDADVITDINQTSLHSPVYISGRRNAVRTGTSLIDDAKNMWVYHDRVGYLVGVNVKVSLSLGPKQGRWSDIGTGSDSLETRSVFDLAIDHGIRPNLARYAYSVVPGVSLNQFRRTLQNKPFTVLENNGKLQAVYDAHMSTIEAVFYEAGHLSTPVGELSVNHSCMLLLSWHPRHGEISISSPDRSAHDVIVNIGAKQLIVVLPSGADAGRSRSLSLGKKAHFVPIR
jgi:chondroitin AC lyase